MPAIRPADVNLEILKEYRYTYCLNHPAPLSLYYELIKIILYIGKSEVYV